MTTEIDANKMGVKVKTIRETKKGGVLIELGKTEQENRARFEEAITRVIGKDAKMQSLTPRVTVEIADIASTSTQEEVEAAIKTSLGESRAEQTEVWLSPNIWRGTRVARAKLAIKEARALEQLGHINVGWVNCRVRIRQVPTRCYRCLGYGHSSGNCRGPDRSKLCRSCGGEGHQSKDCKNKPRCYICAESSPPSDADHAPGSRRCAAYLSAQKGIAAQKWR